MKAYIKIRRDQKLYDSFVFIHSLAHIFETLLCQTLFLHIRNINKQNRQKSLSRGVCMLERKADCEQQLVC